MATRDRIALSVPPLILRVVLAVTFLWAGLSKALTTMSITPETAAALSTMGVSVTNAGPAPVLLPSGSGTGAMADPSTAPSIPRIFLGAGVVGQNGGAGAPPFPADGFSKPKPDSDAKPESKPEQPESSPSETKPASTPPTPVSVPAPATTTPPPSPAPTTTGVVRSPSEFPNPEPVRSVYVLAYSIYAAANPPMAPAGASGEAPATKMRLLPAELGQGSRPVYMAFTICAVEIIAGAMLLLGMMSRVWAFAVAGVMIGAIWMTQLGPAIQSGDTVLWILPNHPWGDVTKWKTLLWQFALLGCAMAVVFAGSGALAVDNAMFGRRADRADLDE